jgi:hypothetical protein
VGRVRVRVRTPASARCNMRTLTVTPVVSAICAHTTPLAYASGNDAFVGTTTPLRQHVMPYGVDAEHTHAATSVSKSTSDASNGLSVNESAANDCARDSNKCCCHQQHTLTTTATSSSPAMRRHKCVVALMCRSVDCLQHTKQHNTIKAHTSAHNHTLKQHNLHAYRSHQNAPSPPAATRAMWSV